MKTKKLTKKQSEILAVITEYIDQHGYAPSIREIGDIMHLVSPSTVYMHLTKLKEKGLVTWEPTQPRTLRLVKTASS
jgi:repressor LexA